MGPWQAAPVGGGFAGAILLGASMRENIAFHQPEISLDEVMRAAERACVHWDIAEMPMGYETRIDEGAISLSGGQRQRLAIAGQPAMLLPDEATVHLDVLTESRVEPYLDGLDCTRWIVAHRLSTIRSADRILVLDEGASMSRTWSYLRGREVCGTGAESRRGGGAL